MAKSPSLPKGKGESLGLWGAEFSEDKANRPPGVSNHSLGNTVPSPTWEPMIIPRDSGDPLNGSSQTEKKPWKPRGIFIKPTDLYFSSAFQMFCVLLNAHKIHWRGGKWLKCTDSVPETHSQDVSLLPPQQLALPLDVLVPKCSLSIPGFALTSP